VEGTSSVCAFAIRLLNPCSDAEHALRAIRLTALGRNLIIQFRPGVADKHSNATPRKRGLRYLFTMRKFYGDRVIGTLTMFAEIRAQSFGSHPLTVGQEGSMGSSLSILSARAWHVTSAQLRTNHGLQRFIILPVSKSRPITRSLRIGIRPEPD
jgi:hypothetical protein